MGCYCYVCKRKKSFGFKPLCCKYEIICRKCKLALLNETCPVELNAYVKKNFKIVDGNIVIAGDQRIVQWLSDKNAAKCPKCLKDVDEDCFEEY